MQNYILRLAVLAQLAYGSATDRVRATKDRGATAVEYGLLVALIAAVIIGAVSLFGGAITGIFTDATTKITPKP